MNLLLLHSHYIILSRRLTFKNFNL